MRDKSKHQKEVIKHHKSQSVYPTMQALNRQKILKKEVMKNE